MTLPLLRRIHRWIGLLIALPIAMQGLTGCILTLADLVPTRHATRHATLAPARPVGEIAAAARPVGEIAAAAQNRVGDGAHATRYNAPPAIGEAATVLVSAGSLSPHEVLIDPSTLTVLAMDPIGARTLAGVRALHVALLAPAYGGRSVIGWFGIGLLAMLVTAIPIWWPRQGRVRAAFTADFRARGVPFHGRSHGAAGAGGRLHGAFGAWGRLHGAAGAWIGCILAVMATSGIVMAFPHSGRLVFGLSPVAAPQPRHPGAAIAPTAADIDRAVARAQQEFPRLALRTAFLPERRSDPVRLVFSRIGETGSVNAVQLLVGLTDLQVRIVDDPATSGLGGVLYRWMHDLHTGSGMGAVWRLVQAAAGLGLPLLALTGSMQWWRKRSARRLLAGARRNAGNRMAPDAEPGRHAIPALQPAAE